MNFLQTLGIVVVTALFTWMGHALVADNQRRNEKDRALEAEKRETYKRFVTLVFDLLRHSDAIRAQQGPVFSELENRFFEVARDMTVYASDDVLDLWVRFKNMGDAPDNKYVLALMGELLVAVRSDLGHTHTRFDAKDLLSTFITNVDTVELPSIR